MREDVGTEVRDAIDAWMPGAIGSNERVTEPGAPTHERLRVAEPRTTVVQDAVSAAPLPSRHPVALGVKRALDVVVSAGLLVLLVPVFVGIVILIRLTSPGPAVLVQRRIGLHGRRFGMFKFRTMVSGAQRQERRLFARLEGRVFHKVPGDPRVTALGRVLRRTSLDELPQLLNVLVGEMSLVGPRPLLTTELEVFPVEREAIRFSVRPGLTGLWQVSGRSLCDDERRLELDRRYVREWSLVLDLVILARTVPAVIGGRGAL